MMGLHDAPAMGPNMSSQPFVTPNPLQLPEPPTQEDLQLSGACDWFKIEKLVHAENKLIHSLQHDGLVHSAWKLQNMRDDLLSHRMANSPFSSAKAFLRNNCANDAYINKWRQDIDQFDKSLTKVLADSHLDPHHAAELRYQSQMLKVQGKASLPFTGYYNGVAKPPTIPPRTYRDHVYHPRFVLKPLVAHPINSAVMSGFL